MSRLKRRDAATYTPDHDQPGHRPGDAATFAPAWYIARAKVWLPAFAAVAVLLGFSATKARSGFAGPRLEALEAHDAVADSTEQAHVAAIRAYVDSQFQTRDAQLSHLGALLEGSLRLQCINTAARDAGLARVPCDSLLGRRGR
jgi:hypothetical protein